VRLEETSARQCGFVSRFRDGRTKIAHKQDRTDDNEQQKQFHRTAPDPQEDKRKWAREMPLIFDLDIVGSLIKIVHSRGKSA
jgi:hypothetical protein